ncbi:MAG: DUF2231 domain-containing protein [Gammaproteobacteria bacterium]|nr:DUF2231 domain-containing protein [Gammaproteobacteria bacterium]
MIEIIPNWHPIFVHFTTGLLITGALLLLAARLRNSREIFTVARWNLWLGTLAAVATVATGLIAYYTVAHDGPSHAAMTLHRNWAIPTAALFVVTALWSLTARRREPERSALFLALVLAAASALAVTGWLGAENVYRYGLGVMSLPEAESEEHGHSHGSGEVSQAFSGDASTHDMEGMKDMPGTEQRSHEHRIAPSDSGESREQQAPHYYGDHPH